jgi:hypothetical protein
MILTRIAHNSCEGETEDITSRIGEIKVKTALRPAQLTSSPNLKLQDSAMPMCRPSPASAELQPDIDNGEAYEVQCGGGVPQIGFERAKVSYPARPQGKADDGEGQKGVQRQEKPGPVEAPPQLGDGAVLHRRAPAGEMEEGPGQVQEEVGRCPGNYQPSQH